jgi:hypothetical protein
MVQQKRRALDVSSQTISFKSNHFVDFICHLCPTKIIVVVCDLAELGIIFVLWWFL